MFRDALGYVPPAQGICELGFVGAIIAGFNDWSFLVGALVGAAVYGVLWLLFNYKDLIK